jgi:hypothetical protein
LTAASGYKQLVQSIFRLKRAPFLAHPIFIVSCGRSGSTALCLALRVHPRLLVAAAEGPNVNALGELAYDFGVGEHAGYYQSASRLPADDMRWRLRDLCYAPVFGSSLGLSYDPRRIAIKESAYTRGTRIARWGAKVFPTEKSAQGLRWLYPGAKFIYIHRNGIDVVQSMSKFGNFAKLDFAERCRFWNERCETYEYLRRWDDVCVIRFEDFLDDNARALKMVYDYLGLPESRASTEFASSRMIHPLDAPTAMQNPKEAIAARESSCASWTSEERATFARICANSMKMLGYELPF